MVYYIYALRVYISKTHFKITKTTIKFTIFVSGIKVMDLYEFTTCHVDKLWHNCGPSIIAPITIIVF